MKKGIWGYMGVFIPAAVAVTAAVIIVSMYAFSSELSRDASELNGGVNLCRSIADLYIAARDEEEFAEGVARIGYEAENRENGYTLYSGEGGEPEAELTIKKSAGGSMEEITVSARAGGREIYALSTSKYTGGGEND